MWIFREFEKRLRIYFILFYVFFLEGEGTIQVFGFFFIVLGGLNSDCVYIDCWFHKLANKVSAV